MAPAKDRVQSPMHTVPDIVRTFKAEGMKGVTERRVRYVIETREIQHVAMIGAYYLYDKDAIQAIRSELIVTWEKRHKTERGKGKRAK